MTDPYMQINGTKIEVFDNDLSAVKSIKQLDEVTLAGAEVLTNKTLTSPIFTGVVLSNGQNLLINPEFQDCNADNLPDFWALVSTPILLIVTDTLAPALGGNQITITGAGTTNEGIYIMGGTANWLKIKPSTTYTFSIYYYVIAGDMVSITIRSFNGATQGTTHITYYGTEATTTRCSVTFTTDADATNLSILIRVSADGDIATVSCPKLEEGSAVTPYIKPDRNKIWVSSIATSATPTPVLMARRIQYNVTALSNATATFGIPTGTPGAIAGDVLIIRIKDNGAARTLAWNAIYRAIGVTLPTITVISKTFYLEFIYNSADTKWDCIRVNAEA